MSRKLKYRFIAEISRRERRPPENLDVWELYHRAHGLISLKGFNAQAWVAYGAGLLGPGRVSDGVERLVCSIDAGCYLLYRKIASEELNLLIPFQRIAILL